MASNIQVVIELLLKNKKELDSIIASLKEKHGIDIDTSDADSAMSAAGSLWKVHLPALWKKIKKWLRRERAKG